MQWVRFLTCINIQCGIPDERRAVIPLAVPLWFPGHLIICLFVGAWACHRSESPNPHGFPFDRHSWHFCCWTASTWIIHHARKKGAAGKPLLSVRVLWVCVEREERGTIYEEVFLWQRCQIELRSLFDGAMGSHETDCLGMSVRV